MIFAKEELVGEYAKVIYDLETEIRLCGARELRPIMRIPPAGLIAAILIFGALVSFRAEAAADAIATTSGWMKFVKDKPNLDFELYRKYSYTESGFPNTIILNCAKAKSKYLPHLTIVLPKSYEPSSFGRDSWQPKIKIHFLVDDKTSFALEGEYRKGEIYVDWTLDNSAEFELIIMADDLAVAFGDRNDMLNFHFTEKMDAVLSEIQKSGMMGAERGPMSHYSRKEALDRCKLPRGLQRNR